MTALTYGVHSEAGKLRRVLVHKPGAAMARLTPANCAELLFDDVIWVKQARIEHMTFVDAMRNRGVEVVFLRQLLMETLKDMEAPAGCSRRGSATIQSASVWPMTSWPT
jgi:arginine deiminase